MMNFEDEIRKVTESVSAAFKHCGTDDAARQAHWDAIYAARYHLSMVNEMMRAERVRGQRGGRF